MARSYESDVIDNNMFRGRNSFSSDSSSDETAPSFTRLGWKIVPVTSSCQELVDAIEEFSWDIPFTAELISISSVYFTDFQLALVQNVLDAAEIEMKFGYTQHFFNDLLDLENSLNDRIEKEKEFFSHQRSIYGRIYDALRQTSFPYSSNQMTCIYSMREALNKVTGNPDSEADQEIGTSLRELTRL